MRCFHAKIKYAKWQASHDGLAMIQCLGGVSLNLPGLCNHRKDRKEQISPTTTIPSLLTHHNVLKIIHAAIGRT